MIEYVAMLWGSGEDVRRVGIHVEGEGMGKKEVVDF